MNGYDVSTFFEKSRSMELANNIYGFSSAATAYNATGELSGDTNNFDTHMIKNMEWGAVAYLTQSKYGRCTDGICNEVYINDSSEYYGDFYTGRSGGSTSASGTTYGTYSYDDYLISDNNEKTTKEAGMGTNASTTGNIYGIYDMNGGTYDYVMGNMAAEDGLFSVGSAGTWTTELLPLAKYYDFYSYGATGSGATDFKRSKLGDATKEVLLNFPFAGVAWNGDLLGASTISRYWPSRGGESGTGDFPGIFSIAYSASAGSGLDDCGARSSLIILS